MSDLKPISPEQQALCLEYVLGSLRGVDRQSFEQQLRHDELLQSTVTYWEETLMALPTPPEVPAPHNTWSQISQRLDQLQKPKMPFFEKLKYGSLGFLSACLAIAFVGFLVWRAPASAPIATTIIPPEQPITAPVAPITPPPTALAWNASYVAVLTDPKGVPLLTVLTQSQGEPPDASHQLRLHAPSHDQSWQLWALSKSDGQIRSLAIINATTALNAPIKLEKSQWALIKDAESLILSEELSGGSNTGVPSEPLLAKGPCVQLANAAPVNKI